MHHELLAEASSKSVDRQRRWHEIRLKRSGSSYVARVAFRTTWDDERGERIYYKCDDWSELERLIKGYDPRTHVHATYPDGPDVPERMRQLHADVNASWADAFRRLALSLALRCEQNKQVS